jgi:hypothetical protein
VKGLRERWNFPLTNAPISDASHATAFREISPLFC